MQPKALLHLEGLRVFAHLGCGEAERALPQEVRFDVLVAFAQNPLGQKTDRLEDTVCYVEICELLHRTATEKPYHLVEHLAEVALNSLKVKFAGYQFRLTVHKVRPPIEGLEGGIRYTIGDFWP